MSERSPGDVTVLLLAWSEGDRGALERLIPLVYEELRRQADRYVRRQAPGGSLQSTAVVHEVYLRLVDQTRAGWKNRAHFFAVAAKAMRQILIDHARRQAAAKRGGNQTRFVLEDAHARTPERSVDLLALDDALDRLNQMDESQARVVELRYFGGLTIDETAEVMGSSPATVKRAWQSARAWLFSELRGAPA